MPLEISLPNDLEAFVRAKVETGRYRSSGDVVREALSLLEQRDQAEANGFAWLRGAWQAGLESGPAGEVDFKALKGEAKARLAATRLP